MYFPEISNVLIFLCFEFTYMSEDTSSFSTVFFSFPYILKFEIKNELFFTFIQAGLPNTIIL